MSGSGIYSPDGNEFKSTAPVEQGQDPLPVHETFEDMLKDWDAGKVCYSVATSGVGPKYEQMIQVAGIEIARALTKFINKIDKHLFGKISADTIKRVGAYMGGLDMPQAQKACWLAKIWNLEGPKGLIAIAVKNHQEDLIIEIQDFWPRLPVQK